MADEIAEIEQAMRDDPAAYWNDAGRQDRYRELLSAAERGEPAPAASSASAEIAELETLMRTDRRRYEESGADARLLSLYREQDATPAKAPEAAPDDGLPRMLSMAEAQEAGLDYAAHVAEHRALADILLPLEGGTRRALAASFEGLPRDVARASLSELTAGSAPAVGHLPGEHELARFRRSPAGFALSQRWGDETPGKLAQLGARMERLGDRLGEGGAVRFDAWLDGQPTAAQIAILKRLAG